MAWSGDVFQAQVSGNSNLKFVVPDEGGMFWHDNCMIPYHAAHPVDAIDVDRLLLPARGAGADHRLGQLRLPGARRASRSSPTSSTTRPSPTARSSSRRRTMQRQLVAYYDFKGVDDHEEWTSIFDPIIQS